MADAERSIEDAVAKTHVIRNEVMRTLMTSQSWPEQALTEMATVASGSTPSRTRADFWSSGVVPWVRTAEINFSTISDTAERITWSAVRETGLRVFPSGTVLLAMYGEGVTRGRSAILGVEATVNQAAAAIVCEKQLLVPQFLFHWLESNYRELRKIGHGSNQTNLNASLVESIRLPLPPLEMQHQVVNHLATFDAQLSANTHELNKLRQLKLGLVDDVLAGNSR
ncbi:restriction endonuclease subunit S [Streptomyces sp. ISL-99]|uniref:restriction endonuclease subunit S n=1 Tax=Streptomyces sp. ISL-99 TaxID=2819193 RepID=UPI001BE8D2B8|nr:restriction endonuclease subunit S [Streptomyces sp. ISL-99]MBT2526172.1 restriction endonuclease subunit S [Streptomyces sp. ISL-99]